MRQRSSKILGVCAVCGLLAYGTWALAQMPPPTAVEGPLGPRAAAALVDGGPPARDLLAALRTVGRYLDLTEDQVTQVREILETTHASIEAIREEIRPLAESLHDELESGAPAPEAVGQLVIQIHALRDQIKGERQSAVDSIRSLLNDEQLQKVDHVVQAARLAPVIRAFRVLGMLPPPGFFAQAGEDQAE